MDKNLKPIAMKRVAQIGIVCHNAQKAVDDFCTLFQVPENRHTMINVKEGENANFSALFGWVNYAGVQFEFIQPLGGGDDKTYSEFLEKTGGGIHHIMFQSDDAASTLEDFRLAGIPEVTPGSYCGQIKDPTVGYFDMREAMGMTFEISTKNVEAMTTLDFDTLFGKRS